MLLLELGNLQRVPYFDINRKRFYFDAKIPALDSFKSRYSQKIWEIMEKMLIDDYRIRPTFENLIENIENKTIHMSSNTTEGAYSSLRDSEY